MGRSLLASIPLRAGELTGISSRTPPCESPTMPLLAPSELRPPGTTRQLIVRPDCLNKGYDIVYMPFGIFVQRIWNDNIVGIRQLPICSVYRCTRLCMVCKRLNEKVRIHFLR